MKKIIPFTLPDNRKSSSERSRAKMTTYSRTTADAVREDSVLWEPITHEEFLGDSSGSQLGNTGGLTEMLERYSKTMKELGIVDPYMENNEG